MTSNVKRFCDSIVVHDVESMDKIRVGSEHDGGYVVLRELCEQTSVLYSFGIGDDHAFESEFAEMFTKAEVQMFDPNIELPSASDRLSFTSTGIGRGYPKLRDVPSHSMLKMDIEWDEWDAILSMDDDVLRSFDQIIVEFHLIHIDPSVNGMTTYFQRLYRNVAEKVTDDLFATYLATVSRLWKTHAIYHIHANNSLPKVCIDGLWLPPLIELSWVRRDLVVFQSPTRSSFPTAGLDSPNKPDRPDVVDYYPLGT